MSSPLPPLPDSRPAAKWQPPSLAALQFLLPQYRFVALIGRGGMGAVYQAVQLSLNRPVAIKMLPADLLADAEANFAARFRQEALTMAKLTHPGIVSVYESGEVGGLLYIVMEFVDGTDVARMIQGEGRLAPELAADFMGQVCEALHYAHEQGVVHRDLKPANLLVTREGRVKIADFGLAKHDDDALLQLTRTNVAIGTLDFLAPEAWTPGTPLDPRADLYSLGVTLYQMLTGEVPRGLWKMPSVKAGVDARFDAVIDRAMQPDPTARYQSSVELRRDLALIQAGPAVIPPAFGPGEAGSSEALRPRRRLAQVLAALVVLLAIATEVVLRSGPAKGRSSAAGLSTVVVNTNDSGPGSLRQAFLDATAIPGSNTITFASALAGQSVIVSSERIGISDRDPVTIDGTGVPGRVTIQGTAQFYVTNGSLVHFVGLTLTGGQAPYGALLLNDGITTLTDCLITGNFAAQNGGALGNNGTLSLVRCTLTGNTAGVNGGALNNLGTLTLTDCTLSRNTAGNGGGAVYTSAPGNATLVRCTLAENEARRLGGAVMVSDGEARFVHCTIVSNHALGLTLASHGGGGVAALEKAQVQLDATIVAGNDAATGSGPDLWMIGTVIHSRRSLIGNGKDSTLGVLLDDNSVGTPDAPLKPFLKPLGRHGGPTETMPPLPSSPVIDKAHGSTATHDQRGLPIVGVPDIGAAEWQPAKSDPTQTAQAAAATHTVRDAARWLLKCKAEIRVSIGGRAFAVGSEEELPAGDFHLVTLWFDRWRSDLPLPTDADFQVLRAVTTLRQVFVRVLGLTDEAFAFLADNPHLALLTLERMPDLTDGVLQHVAGLKELEELNIIGARGVTGRGLGSAAWLASVRKAAFTDSSLDGPAVQKLGACPRLGRVWVSGERLTHGGLNGLFSSLSLTNVAVTRAYHLDDPVFADALKRLPQARQLHVEATGLGDLAAGSVATLTNLVELNLKSTQLTDAGLAKLHGLHELKLLELGFTQVTPAGVAAFQQANPRCQIKTN